MYKKVLNERIMDEFKEYLLREEKSEATVEKYLRDVRSFMNYLSGAQITKEYMVAWYR